MLSRRSFMLSGAALAAGCGADEGGATASGQPAQSDADLSALREKLAGRVIGAGDDGYDKLRRTFSFNPRTDRSPLAIARCVSDTDVARCIEFARAKALPLAVRGGGHDVLAASTVENGLIIDLAEMNDIRLEGDDVTMTIGAGSRAGSIDSFAAANGKLLPLGCNSQVGVGGLTLGGGLGWFMGAAGATCDHLRRARIVTADGQILTVSDNENPDLFWALRGGGGNFGVVTEFNFETRPMPQTSGGYIAFDGAALPEFLRFFRDYMANAPDGLVAEMLAMAPAGDVVIFVMACFSGPEEDARRAFAPLRAFATPLADGLRTLDYPAVMAPTDAVGALFRGDPDAPKEPNDAPGVQWLGGSLPRLDDAAIDVIAARIADAEGGWAFNLGHYMHGEVCRATAARSPLPRPEGSFTYHFDAWWGSAAAAAEKMAWVDGAVAAMRPFEAPAYVNYLRKDDPAAVAAAYGDSFERLAALKLRYDPDNIFSRNRNIRPNEGAG